MSMTSETLRLLITGDSDGAVQAFKKAGAAADRDLGKAEDKAEKTSAQLTKMGAASLAAGAVMVTALASTIKPASDLNEAINVVGLTFGDSADEIVEWGKSAASSTGLAADAALSGAAAVGGLLQNMGFMQDESVALSKDLVTLAADMGSAFNMSTTDALEAIRSGLQGQSEPLRKFNVFLSDAAIKSKALEDGIWDGVGAMDEQEKTLARLAIITEQTATIQGDFANTNDGVANAAKVAAAEFTNMKAAIGTELLPIVTEGLGVFNSLIGAFNDLPGPVKAVVGQVALFTTGILLAGGAALTMAARVKALNTALSTMSTRLNMSKAAMLGWAGAAAAAIALQQEWSGAREASAAADRAANESIEQGASAVDNYTNILNGLAAASPELQTALARVDGGAAGLAARFAESGDKGAALDEILAGLVENGQYVDGAFETAGLAVAAMSNATNDVAAAAENANGTIPALSGSVDSLFRNVSNAGDATRNNLNPALGDAKVPVDDLQSALSDLNGELDELFGSVQSADELEADFQKTLDDVTKSIEDNGKAIGTQTDEQRANLDARGDVIQSINDTVQAMVDEGAGSDDIVRKSRNMIKAYEDTLVAAGLTRAEAQEYTAVLKDIPAEVRSELELSNYDTAIARAQYYKDLIDQIPRQVDTFVNLYGPGSASAGGGGGGSSDDEDSRPLDLPPLGEDRSARKPRMGRSFDRGGDGKTINQTVTVELDGREIARSVERWSDREGGLRIKTRAGN